MYLVDTNIISELAKTSPNSGVLAWAGRATNYSISTITVDEIYFGLTRKASPRLTSWFNNFFQSSVEILPFTEQVAKVSGSMRAELSMTGKARTQADMIIAATAAVHGLILVTRNTKDFEGCSVSILNPFST